MKQLLLRVPGDVHRRLAARAGREGRSINAVATEMLDAAVDVDQGDRQARVRAKVAALGLSHALEAPPGPVVTRQRAIESTRGLGPMADQLIADERDRL